MLLLGVGDDGHCGSLHPKSEHIKAVGDGTVTFGIHKPGKNQSPDLVSGRNRQEWLDFTMFAWVGLDMFLIIPKIEEIMIIAKWRLVDA